MAAGNLTRRILFAAVAIPVAIAVAYVGGWPFAVLIAAVSVLGTREVYDFAAARQILPLRLLGYTGALAVPLATARWVGAPYASSWPWLLYGGAAWILVLLVAAAWRGPDKGPLAAIGVTMFGALYAGALPAFAIALRHRYGVGVNDAPLAGTLLLFFPLVLTWIGDTAAYAGGVAIGGPKLAPRLSPRKTWAGALAGLAGTMAAAAAFNLWAFPRAGIAVAMGWVIVMAVVIAVAGQIGDLAESVLKREIGIKDSSALIPGHGGVLDRFDALYFVLPVTAMLYALILPVGR